MATCETGWRRPDAAALLMAAGVALWMGGANAAQNAPSSPAATSAAADPVFDAQKTAFEALSEADRKAIQDALVWTGDYNGVVDGAFGKRTRDSILAYQASIKAPTTGIVDAGAIARLVATAQKAKDAIKFQIFVDDKTGVEIGAPLKVLDKKAASAAGARLMKSDGSATLDLVAASGGEANLAALFARLAADQPGKKTTLKLSRPDFFVVAYEEGGRKVYSRFAKAPAGAPDSNAVRGFTLTYPAQSADFDRLAVAIANSFEPFPAPAAKQQTTAASTTAPATVGPAKAALSASGLLVAAGQALSAIGSSECPHPSVEGKPGKYLSEDKTSGLSLIAASLDRPVAPPVLAPLSEDLVALTYGSDDSVARPSLVLATVAPLAQTASDPRPLVLASFGSGAVGGPVFDRRGALVALVARGTGADKLVAGVSPLAPHRVIVAADIERFLSAADVAIGKPADEATSSAGRIAADKRALVVAIVCN